MIGWKADVAHSRGRSEVRNEGGQKNEKEVEHWVGSGNRRGLGDRHSRSRAGSQYGQAGQSQPPVQQTDKPKTPEVTPLTLDASPPVSAEEDAAYKAFQSH